MDKGSYYLKLQVLGGMFVFSREVFAGLHVVGMQIVLINSSLKAGLISKNLVKCYEPAKPAPDLGMLKGNSDVKSWSSVAISQSTKIISLPWSLDSPIQLSILLTSCL